jgi:exodeoxyribonuclease VII large subunit
VFVGVGHEKDKTILDEYAHASFGTPSKVIGHIRQTIVARAMAIEKHFDEIVSTTWSRLTIAESRADAAQASVATHAVRMLDLAAHKADDAHLRVGSLAQVSLQQAEERATNLVRTIAERAETAVMALERTVDACHAQVSSDARRTLEAAAVQAAHHWNSIETAAAQSVVNIDQDIERDFTDVKFFAARAVDSAARDVEDLMVGILAHSIEPTLRRGFAIVKTESGDPVSSREKALAHEHLTIQFRDGDIPVSMRKTT